MGKKKKVPVMKINKGELRNKITDFLSEHRGEAFSLKKFFRALKLTSHPLKMLCVDIINEMLDSGIVSRDSDGLISYNAQSQAAEGIYYHKGNGKGYVKTDEGSIVKVYDDDAGHAMNGDRVKVVLMAKKKKTNSVKGEIIEIVKRSDKPIIGTIQINNDIAFLVNYTGVLAHDILIPKDNLHGAKHNDKVLAKVIEWNDTQRNPVGEVIDVLGKSGENNTEMHAILAEYGLPYSYPENVVKAAEKLVPGITPEEISKREDFRKVCTFTIDPHDAKDFDDALSIRKLKNGLWEVGVHIADVSHYVKEGSIIDKEAYKRATSVYLVDRTVPMLPERLCNFICSLRPDEEKLTYSVIFEMDDEAVVHDSHIAHTVIKSNRRFAYEEVQEILEQNGEALDVPNAVPVPIKKRKGELANELITLNRMAHKLRERRFANGSIDFNSEEMKFEIDENGKPLKVYFKTSKDANKLIEEFMLLANRTVAESIGRPHGLGKPKTLPYRIHDVPDPNKLDTLSAFVSKFGLRLTTNGNRYEVASSLNKLLADVKNQKMENLVESVALRAMSKARYSTFNIGHYGLAFDYYTHFTSPIRRYPDLMVHRLLTLYSQGGKSVNQAKYEDYCDHCSEMEQLAASAERASIKYKQVEYLADKIGQEFDATISGITEYGLYAEINENHCEGLVSMRWLGNETFDFDDKSYSLVGRTSGKRYTLGDKIRIKVAAANLYKKQIDFEIVKPEKEDITKKKPFYVDVAQVKKSKKEKKGKKSKK